MQRFFCLKAACRRAYWINGSNGTENVGLVCSLLNVITAIGQNDGQNDGLFD